jgi:hypothetical protein
VNAEGLFHLAMAAPAVRDAHEEAFFILTWQASPFPEPIQGRMKGRRDFLISHKNPMTTTVLSQLRFPEVTNKHPRCQIEPSPA